MKWHETDNGVRTLQSIARNLNRLTEAESITPWDLFAAAALHAFMVDEDVVLLHPELARDAYSVADAMMEARAKRKDQV